MSLNVSYDDDDDDDDASIKKPRILYQIFNLRLNAQAYVNKLMLMVFVKV